MTICKRGEIWMVNFNPGRGSEQTGVRPALIIQNDIGNQYASTTVVAAYNNNHKKVSCYGIISPRKRWIETKLYGEFGTNPHH
jgi:mRNA-degrading endonuclease toxin of MazEF toxin-antitoxin module